MPSEYEPDEGRPDSRSRRQHGNSRAPAAHDQHEVAPDIEYVPANRSLSAPRNSKPKRIEHAPAGHGIQSMPIKT